MSTTTLQALIAIILVAHGIGHVLGILPALGTRLTPTHSSDSWLLTRLLGGTATNVIAFMIFLVALLAFAGAGLGLLGWLVPHDRWQTLAILGSLISTAGLALYWRAFPTVFPNLVGAIAVNIAVLVALLWLQWPPGLVS